MEYRVKTSEMDYLLRPTDHSLTEVETLKKWTNDTRENLQQILQV